MAYDVQFTGSDRRAMQSIPPRVVPAIIGFVFGDLARGSHRVGKPRERELRGLSVARRGPYRLRYRIEDQAQRVYIVHVDHLAGVDRPR